MVINNYLQSRFNVQVNIFLSDQIYVFVRFLPMIHSHVGAWWHIYEHSATVLETGVDNCNHMLYDKNWVCINIKVTAISCCLVNAKNHFRKPRSFNRVDTVFTQLHG